MNTKSMELKRLSIITIFVVIFMMAMTMLATSEVSAASKPGQVKSLKVSSKSYNSLKISWKKVSRATGYQVYRATKMKGSYKKVTTVKKGKTVSYTNKKLTTGKRYYYKVRALKGKKKGKFSAVKSGIARVGQPTIKGTASTTSIKLTWNKVSGATGYRIYRGNTCIKTTKASSYTNSGLKQGTAYSYKVRAYRTVKGKNYYGNYSSTKKIITKVSNSTVTLNYEGKTLKLGSAFDVNRLGTADLVVKRGIRTVYVYDSKDYSNYLELNIGASGSWKGKIVGWYTNQEQIGVVNGKTVKRGLSNAQAQSIMNSSTRTASNYTGAKNFAMNHEGKFAVSGQKVDGTMFCAMRNQGGNIQAGEIRLRYIEEFYDPDLKKEDLLVEHRINSLRVRQDRGVMTHNDTVYKVAEYAAKDWAKSGTTAPNGTAHVTSNGKELEQREAMFGIQPPSGGENSYGPIYGHEIEDNNGLASIEVIGWYNSTGHLSNMIALVVETAYANCTVRKGNCFYANTNFINPKHLPNN